MAQQSNSGLGRQIFEVCISSTDTPGRTPVNEWSARRRGRYLLNTTQTQEITSMPSARFELAIRGSEPPQTFYLDRTATGLD